MQPKTLSAPIDIGRKTAPNRLVNHPMECNDADASGNPTELTLKRYRRLAQGGAGIIMVESLTISPQSRSRENQLQITEPNRDGLADLVKEMKRVNDRSLIIFQINHSGNVSNGSFSEVVSYYPTDDPSVTLLSDDDMEIIKQQFVGAAVIAHEAGADGIDFKQCHGYLCGQLLRPANTKPGRFGGSFENRTRFFRETAEEIKHAVNDDTFILGARFSFYEGIRGGFGTAGPEAVAEDPLEPTAFVRMMESAGCHFISVSGGVPVFTPEITRPSKNYPLGVYRHFSWMEAVKRAVSIPLIGSGYSYLRNGKNRLPEHDPEKKSLLYWAGKNIQNGQADLVGIGRQSLADPLFAKKVLSGKIDSIDFCTACGNCSELLKSQARVGCTVFDPFYRDELRRIKKGST
jgi:2,4-dienoyl-CoA reductase-like NADH-dependent reductase (Old Yellow Enzyme family)